MLFDTYTLFVAFSVCLLVDKSFCSSNISPSILFFSGRILTMISVLVSLFSVTFDAIEMKILYITLFVFSLFYDVLMQFMHKIQFFEDRMEPIEEKFSSDEMINDEYINDQEEKYIIKQIHDYFNQTQKYLDNDFDLDVLARELNIPRRKLSQAINKQTGDNFYRFVAKYRINFAKKLITTHNNYSFDYLCNLSGFSSKTSFNKYFKDFVGITPKEYKLMLNG